MDEEDPIAAFLEARELATPGPVSVEGDPLVEPGYETTIYLVADGHTVWEAMHHNPPALAEINIDRPLSWANAQFIEAAYNPALVAAIQALQARVKELESTLNKPIDTVNRLC